MTDVDMINEEISRLGRELDLLRKELDALLELVGEQGGSSASCPSAPQAPATVEDAVHQAASYAESVGAPVVFAKGAYKSARRSRFNRPDEVLRLLRQLVDASSKWRDGKLDNWKSEFGTEYREEVSFHARNEFADDYVVNHDGQWYQLGPHFRVGTGAPTTVLRIYWAVDRDSRRIVVGHVGKKLRDKSNP